ncbi:MAG: hypothetical protein A3C04_04305 [Candidatus Wildermuthbacteria bacterium RIFCSPHIGHO2_02_FULL_45_25]|uniref:Oxidized purine nucleoside triphosphate hydrolase n=1 Tax=Candidatus Wildermuthbacteria bacterium RIFCSPHIGHO2_02_FULL_45_25 TaxID=1802450 RepID=A0A1G2R0U1_9BACT|nr:MAG: hypothetical protein A3C04_04305 [Candidatus Wildermuthbacteria bacterium RIFCSPHIGHO2_02_FULL_45_25]
MIKVLTLCIIHQGHQVLLGMKKRGFGQGRWNGFGGKVHEGESIEEAMKRELKEEAGIVLNSYEKKGVIDFEFQGEAQILEVHVFKGSEFEGEPVETEEMKPQWFAIGDIPFDQMWVDDKYWLPSVLEGKNFKAKFLFADEDTLIDHTIEWKQPE